MVSKEQVLDNYLIWELSKQKGIQKIITESPEDQENSVKEIIKKAKQDYREKNYNRKQKIDLIKELDNNPEYRQRIFENCSWTKKTVKITDLGTTLPRFGGLPPEIISKELQKVLKFVKKADPDEYQSIKYIKSLKNFPEIIDQFYPWVITPGNRKSKKDRMNRIHGKKDWKIKETWGMINDGNHRALAQLLKNDSNQVKCYVGQRNNY